MTAAPRVWVTRPAAEAGHWVAELQALGAQAVALPLIGIAPMADPVPLRTAWDGLTRYRALMFVSGNAVQYFMAERPASVGVWPWAWATGPGTVRALQQAGWPGGCIAAPVAEAAQFDSETLWARVAPSVQPGDRVLIVRGADAQGQEAGRNWLAGQLQAAGVQVDTLSSYRRVPPVWDAAMHARMQQAASDGSIWLFSSSEAIANLQALLPGQDWSAARAVATHPRIAASARQAGWGRVAETRPEPAAVWASIKSLR